MTAWHRPDVETAALEYLSQVIAPASARQIVDGLLARGRVRGLLDAAEIVDNDDDCSCGGCDTCLPRKLAVQVRSRAYGLAKAGA